MKFCEILETKSIPAEPPIGKVIGKYTDAEGYTIFIVGGVPKGSKYDPALRPFGTMLRKSPDGEVVKGGWFMNWPEASYGVTNDEWHKLSWKTRGEMEAKQQATAYASLKHNFDFHKKYSGVVKLPITFVSANPQ